MSRFLLGLLFLAVGIVAIYYSSQLEKILGPMSWAEKFFGGTKQGIIVIGFVVMVIGFLMMFGVIDLNSGIQNI